MGKNSMNDTGINAKVIGFWSTNSGKHKAVIQRDGEERINQGGLPP